MVVVRRCLSLLYVVHVMVGNLLKDTVDYKFEHYTAAAVVVVVVVDFDIVDVVVDNIAEDIVEEEDPIYRYSFVVGFVENCQVMNCN